MSFCDPGMLKEPHCICNYGRSGETVLVKNAPVDRTAVTGTAKVTDGKLTVNLRSEDKAINICYIIIRPVETETAPTIGRKGDVNLDDDVNIADAVLMQRYLLGNTSITGEQAYAGDVCSDALMDGFDMAMLRKKLIEMG